MVEYRLELQTTVENATQHQVIGLNKARNGWWKGYGANVDGPMLIGCGA